MIDITGFICRIDKDKWASWLVREFREETVFELPHLRGQLSFTILQVQWMKNESGGGISDELEISGVFSFRNEEIEISASGKVGGRIQWGNSDSIIPFSATDIVVSEEFFIEVNGNTIRCPKTLNLLLANYKAKIIESIEGKFNSELFQFLSEMYGTLDQYSWNADSIRGSVVLVKTTDTFVDLLFDFRRIKEPLSALSIPSGGDGVKVEIPTHFLIEKIVEDIPIIIGVQNFEFVLTNIEPLDLNYCRIELAQKGGKKKINIFANIYYSTAGTMTLKIADLKVEGIGFIQRAILGIFRAAIVSKIEEKGIDLSAEIQKQRHLFEKQYPFLSLISLARWHPVFFSISPDFTKLVIGSLSNE